MNRLGFENTTGRIDGRVVRCYRKINKKKNESESKGKMLNQELQDQDGFDSKPLNLNSSEETNLDI
jgi:hypothetical protein